MLLTAAVLAPAPAGEEAPSALYDKAGVTHNDQCIQPAADRRVLVRDLDAAQLQTYGGGLSDPAQVGETCSATAGVRIEGIEALSSHGMTLYYTWPLEAGEQSPGFIAGSELASAPALDGADAAGNGAPAPPAPGEPAYAITPQDIAHEQRYEGPGSGLWYTYSVYGRPVGGARFALMTWSWIDVAGGGIARAAVSEGELFHPANVRPITMYTFAGAGQPANGSVTARYGYVWDGVQRIYGWMVSSHTFGETCFDHMAYVGGGPPLEQTLCPEGMLRDSIGDAARL